MIDYERKVPECFLIDSRDFQLLIRLLTIGMSSAKHDSSTLLHVNNPEIINTISLPLLLTKVGVIDSKYEFTDKQMIHICRCFKDIVRKKGTLESVKEICKLYSACNDVTVDVILIDKSSIFITYEGVVDIALLDSLIKYVLPVGCIYTIQNVKSDNIDQQFAVDNDVESVLRRGDNRFEIYTNEDDDTRLHKVNTTEVFKAIPKVTWGEITSDNWRTLKDLTWDELLYNIRDNEE